MQELRGADVERVTGAGVRLPVRLPTITQLRDTWGAGSERIRAWWAQRQAGKAAEAAGRELPIHGENVEPGPGRSDGWRRLFERR